jgi:hypothetical protein
MTTLNDLLDRSPVDRISAEARQVDFGRAFLVAVAALFVFIGRAVGVFVNAFAWVFVAVRLGYREVRPPRTDTSRR